MDTPTIYKFSGSSSGGIESYDIEGAFVINGIWGLSLARQVLRHGDARTRSAVTAPSGGLLRLSARNNYSMSPSLFPVFPVTNCTTITDCMSSKPETILPIPVQYARYQIHREGPKCTTCRQTHDGMIHFKIITSHKYNRLHTKKMRYNTLTSCPLLYNLYVSALHERHGIALHTFFKRNLNSTHK